ncbi:MAG TPA: DUF1365 domain-containing protein [Candidatus Dormibacteraeota bacterium]
MTQAACIYEGAVTHRRHTPVQHHLRYSLFMVYVDLAQIASAFGGLPLWSGTRPAPVWFRRADHFGDPSQPLEVAVRNLVEEETGVRPSGPIRLLTHLRYLGVCFNPISLYYCFDQDETLRHVVAEVTNTPWGERRCYVLEVGEGAGHTGLRDLVFEKALHVSPFMPMEVTYRCRLSQPGESVAVAIDCEHEGAVMLHASLGLRRRALDRGTAASLLWRRLPMTWVVLSGIYWHALRLRLKGVPVHAHTPASRSGGGSRWRSARHAATARSRSSSAG